MNKKMILKVSSIILVIALIIVGYFIINKSDKSEEPNKNVDNEIEDNENNGQNENDNNNSTIPSDSKILVVYYSASGSTKKVAEQIKENLNADLFEVIPEEIYTSQDLNWNDVNSRVSREHNDESLRDVKLKNTTVSNWNDYDTVIIGYPIWWGIAAWPVNNFVKLNDFSNKTVIPFCTSASSGLGQSGELLEQEANGGNWLEGHRFSSGASSSEIKSWTDSLK